MRPIPSFVAVILLMVISVSQSVTGPRASAQEATPVVAATHPLVGTWQANASDPERLPGLSIASDDGGWIQVDLYGNLAVGRWESTGPQTANLTIWSLSRDGDDFAGTYVLRCAVEVSADGQQLTITYTGEFIAADGSASGQYGPETTTAIRLNAEPMGEPIGPYEDLFD